MAGHVPQTLDEHSTTPGFRAFPSLKDCRPPIYYPHLINRCNIFKLNTFTNTAAWETNPTATMTTTALALLVTTGMIFLSHAHAECTFSTPGHTVVQAPNGILTFNDENGFRQLKGETFNVNNCLRHRNFPTGQVYKKDKTYTNMGQETPADTTYCRVTTDGNKAYYNSFQAIVFAADGWTFQPESIAIDDIDAQNDARTPAEGWKESAAVFGLRGKKVMRPTLTFHGESLLKQMEYFVPKAALDEMKLGMSQKDIAAVGAEYNSNEMIDCPFRPELESSKRCRTTVRFDKPIDKLVMMYGVKQLSKTDPSSAIFFSKITMKCGCRCKTTDVGTRKITAAVPGVDGQCVQRESSFPETECDVMGGKWCQKEDVAQYFVTGTSLENGSYPCQRRSGYAAQVETTYTAPAGPVGPVGQLVPVGPAIPR